MAMFYKTIFSLINKQNFTLNSRRDNELAVLPQRGGVTKNLGKICLPAGNLDFAQSLRYVSSADIHLPSSTSLDIGQNQDFNLVKI